MYFKSHYIFYLCLEKQSLQYTGRSPDGLNGTCVRFPQEAQTAGYISLFEDLRLSLREPFLRAARQSLQRPGSLVKPFSS